MVNKKDEIIESTIKAFFIRGEKWSLDDVAKDVNCSKTLIIQYHSNKENLLADCFDVICKDIKSSLSCVPFPIDCSVDNLKDYLCKTWMQYFHYLLNNPERAELFIRYTTHHQYAPGCIALHDLPLEYALKKILGDNYSVIKSIDEDFELIVKYMVSVANAMATSVSKGEFKDDSDLPDKIIKLITDGVYPK